MSDEPIECLILDVADLDWATLIDPQSPLGRTLAEVERRGERVSAFNNFI